MADKKISQLTALSAANVASATDVLAIVDTSATETKKITAKDLIDGALNGGTANGVLYLNGSKVATSGSALTFDGTSLVGSNFRSNSFVEIRSDTANLYWENAANTRYYSMALSGTSTSPTLLTTYFDGTSVLNRLALDTSGNLGIGTSSPAAKLNVDAGSAGLMSVFDSTNANGGYLLGRSSGTAVWDLGSAKQALNVGGATDFGINVRSGFMAFGTNNTERMRLDSSGNLGIGTASPAQKLDVAGGMKGGVIHRKGTYSAGATTPSVSGVSYLDINNSSPTSITNFTGAVEGQVLILLFRNANTTITRNNAYLAGSVNFTSATNATLTLVYDGTSWYEICRSTSNG